MNKVCALLKNLNLRIDPDGHLDIPIDELETKYPQVVTVKVISNMRKVVEEEIEVEEPVYEEVEVTEVRIENVDGIPTPRPYKTKRLQQKYEEVEITDDYGNPIKYKIPVLTKTKRVVPKEVPDEDLIVKNINFDEIIKLLLLAVKELIEEVEAIKAYQKSLTSS